MTDQPVKETTFGFHTPHLPCCMCGEHKNNRQSRRFGYVVCEGHIGTPASQVPMQAALVGR